MNFEMPSGKSNVHRGNKGGKEPQMEFEHAGAIIWLFYRPAHIYLVKKRGEKSEESGKSTLLSLMAVVVPCHTTYTKPGKTIVAAKANRL